MKFATCNEYFEGWKIEDVFDYAAEIGYDGVEIAPFTLASSVDEIGSQRRGEIRAAAAAAGVEIVGLHWLLASPEGLYIDHPDDAIRSRTRDYLKELIHFCGDLGGQVMIFGSPQQRNVQEGWDSGETWERMRSVFAEVAPVAGELDEKEEFSVELTRKMGEIGLFGMFVADEFGGQGMDYVSYIIAVEEVARVVGAEEE